MKKIIAASVAAALALALVVSPVMAERQDRVTICHAAGLDGTTHYVEITVGYPAVYGPGGHFFENGTPRAGHEEDYLGPCPTQATPSPSASPSDPTPTETPTLPSSTPTLMPTESPSSTPTPSPSESTQPTPSESPRLTPNPTLPPTDTAPLPVMDSDLRWLLLVSAIGTAAYLLIWLKKRPYGHNG